MRKFLQRRIQPGLNTPAANPGTSLAPRIVKEVLRSPGRPLDTATRAFFEPRYGHDFSRVRVHTDRQAVESARAVHAVAYTVGSNIAFAENHYRPHTPQGSRLLAHELAHVAQQRGTAESGLNPEIGNPSDLTERDADAAAEQAFKGPGPFPVRTLDASRTLRRTTVETWAGIFDNDRLYKLKNENDGKGNGAYGATILVRFTPKSIVQADKVALVQTATSQRNGDNFFIGSAAERKAAEARSTAGGVHIDQINPSSRSPLVGMKDPPSSSNDLAASNPSPSTQFGTPSAKDVESRQALLADPAGLGPVPDDVSASQTLETTALAVSGLQKGVYYGAVRWGWDKPAGAKAATLKPFERISQDAPSSSFSQAAELWNASTTDQNAKRIPLPIVSGKFVAHTKTPLMEHADGGKRIAQLELNTRVEITEQVDPKHTDWNSVIVVEGSQAGKQGWVKTSFLSDLTRKKSL